MASMPTGTNSTNHLAPGPTARSSRDQRTGCELCARVAPVSTVNGSVTMQASRTQPGGSLESAGTHRPIHTPALDTCREQSPQHRQGAAVPAHGRGPVSGAPSGSPGSSVKRLQAQVVGADSELRFKSRRTGHAGERRPAGIDLKKQSVRGTDGLGWS